MSSVQDMVVIYFIRTNERHTQNDEMEIGKKNIDWDDDEETKRKENENIRVYKH